ncbi:hypothetical protein ACP275_12G102700 [Erythranthe tilingii]
MSLRSPNLYSWFSSNPTTAKPPILTVSGGAISSVACNAARKSSKSVHDLPANTAGTGIRCCPCCFPRRHCLGAVIATCLSPPILPSSASDGDSAPQDHIAMLNRIHPPRLDWYEEFYASAMDKTMKPYEAEIAGYKSLLFANLIGKADKILEIGIGTGPNLKYYADCPGVEVFGVDPNRKMEKYAVAAAEAAGLPLSNFRFEQAVAEALPLNDASVDVVVGTLVLCSVEDVDQALREVKRVLKPGGLYIFVEHVAAKDGTILRFLQGILDPLQQTLADRCHLTRNTATNIAGAGFAGVDVNRANLSTASLINPHVYGIAYK